MFAFIVPPFKLKVGHLYLISMARGIHQVIGLTSVEVRHYFTKNFLPETMRAYQKNKTIYVKHQLEHLFTPAIKSSTKRGPHYFSLYKQKRMSTYEYNSLRNRIENELRNAKKKYYHKFFQEQKKKR